jgi:hypothetical protein
MSGKRAKTLRNTAVCELRERDAAAMDVESRVTDLPVSLEKPVAESPVRELGDDGPIPQVLDSVLARSLQRDQKGRFVHGAVKTGEHSERLWSELAPVKAEIVAAVRRQLAADAEDAPPTLLAIIDGFAEAHLLRKSTFMQLAQRGGPVTNKGKVRGLLQAWGAFFDREMRAAEKLGLERRSRNVNETPREWLERLHAERDEDNAADDAS